MQKNKANPVSEAPTSPGSAPIAAAASRGMAMDMAASSAKAEAGQALAERPQARGRFGIHRRRRHLREAERTAMLVVLCRPVVAAGLRIRRGGGVQGRQRALRGGVVLVAIARPFATELTVQPGTPSHQPRHGN